jgi:DNA polymerase elongation subunit (family B)
MLYGVIYYRLLKNKKVYLKKMIVCLDFLSLYPCMMVGGNLYSPANIQKGEKYWQGSGIYSSIYQNERDGIKGKYSQTQGVIEKIITSLLYERIKQKENPQKKLSIKILINTLYGILGSPKFKSIHNLVSASDVTAMARRSILHARTILNEFGYEVLYSDTDSAYVLVKDNNLDRLNEVIKYIVNIQKQSMNIPFELHNFKLEYIIKRMYFFRDDKGNFIKKHYIFITEKDELIYKGINIKKGNCSEFSKLFFEQVIKQKMLDNKYQPYEPGQLLKELKQFVIGKETLLQKRYRVNNPDSYKIPEGKEESTSLMYKISKKYGAGEHYLIINKRIGIGEGNKYAKLEELQNKYGEYWLNQICFDIYMKELNEFIIWNKRNQITKIDRKKIN